MYSWRQDNATVTCGIAVPVGTTHEQLKLLLTRRRMTLQIAGSEPLLRRQLSAPVVPSRTRAYTMYVPEDDDGQPEVRVVLFKESIAGWGSLFAGDLRGQGLCKSLHGELCATLDQADTSGSGHDEEGPAEEDPPGGAISMPRLRQTWRGPVAPGRRAGQPGAAARGGSSRNVDAARPLLAGLFPFGRGEVEDEWSVIRASSMRTAPEPTGARQSWRPAVRRPREPAQPPTAGEAVEAGGIVLASGDAGGGAPAPSGGSAAARSRQKKPKPPVPAYKGRVDPDAESSSSDDLGSDPGEEREYPLPGSEARCDGCACRSRRYYHCIQCGIGDAAFDLCVRCHRRGYYPKEHMRTYPHHDLEMVTPKAAPITRKPPPTAPPGGGKAPTGAFEAGVARGALTPLKAPALAPPASRAMVKAATPLVANTKYSWTQTDEEINLTVKLPPGLSRREIAVEIRPWLLRVTARGGHTLLEGSLDKPVVASEATWTWEPGEVQIMLPKEGGGPMFSRLFPSEEKLNPTLAIKQICEDEPYQGRYMDLTPEGRKIVDLHRNYNHARATGKAEWCGRHAPRPRPDPELGNHAVPLHPQADSPLPLTHIFAPLPPALSLPRQAIANPAHPSRPKRKSRPEVKVIPKAISSRRLVGASHRARRVLVPFPLTPCLRTRHMQGHRAGGGHEDDALLVGEGQQGRLGDRGRGEERGSHGEAGLSARREGRGGARLACVKDGVAWARRKQCAGGRRCDRGAGEGEASRRAARARACTCTRARSLSSQQRRRTRTAAHV